MARVTYTPAKPVDDARDPTAYNTALTSVEAQTAALDTTNLAEQGLDLRHIETGHRTASRLFMISEDTRAVSGLTDHAGTWQTTGLVWAGATQQLLYNASFTLEADEALLIRWRVHFSTALGTPPATGAPTYGIPDAGEFRGRVGYLINGGAHASLSESVRRIKPAGGFAAINGSHGTCTGIAVLQPGVATAYDYVQLDWFTNGGGNNYYPDCAVFMGHVYTKVT